VIRRPLVALVAVSALVLVARPTLAQPGPDRDVPVIFVHGLEPFGFGYPCPGYWGVMKGAFQGYGWSGGLVTMKYYAGDSLCDDDLDHDGSHDAHFGNDDPASPGFNHSYLDPNAHSSETPIEHLGYHLAWYVYDHYSQFGQTVDLVGHSMGGLIIRSALTDQQRGDPDFPPYLYVANVVTLETPHAGADLASLCGLSLQCREMTPGSSFLRNLDPDPQATGGTEWTVVGSDSDELVDPLSAVAMDAAHRIVYHTPDYDHFAVLWDGSGKRDAVWRQSDDGGRWITRRDRPRSVRETDLAAAFLGA
jgi:hypothetical protein